MDIKGKVIEVMQTRKVSEKFQVREFVLETDEKYPQQIIMQVTQERCSLLDNIEQGNEVQVFINVRGRAWTNPQGEVKYFNTLEVWKITNEDEASIESYQEDLNKFQKSGIEANFVEDAISTEVDDDLPF
jgi:hypothetical protein